ncbi:hypothetical protein PCH_Pc09g00140 [Penicillium rubens Wisconsin 54-1255]|uniref:Uncharacterized protein n=1 Tax=Penicillium rubens (strain ATCC 28089 / DSM 1075 / NRRL 1951 / Wisconsin 54-1255) TaxID=500485 RepID=B6GWL0_PENRW|nr:hypothetical protein PCH_Pc09g00140 [Penicillium rubens Wisconsin 54-1255]
MIAKKGSRDRHPLARLQRYYHTNETLEANSTRRANQTPRVNLDRRRYGSAMQISATTHGTVDQGGSICGEKMETIAKVQTRFTGPKLTAVDVGWNRVLLPRSDCWGSEYSEYHTVFGDRMVGYNPTRGCVLLCSLGRSRWKKLRIFSCTKLSPDDYTGYTLFEPDNSSPYAQFYRQSGNSSRWLVEIMPVDHMSLRKLSPVFELNPENRLAPGGGCCGPAHLRHLNCILSTLRVSIMTLNVEYLLIKYCPFPISYI